MGGHFGRACEETGSKGAGLVVGEGGGRAFEHKEAGVPVW